MKLSRQQQSQRASCQRQSKPRGQRLQKLLLRHFLKMATMLKQQARQPPMKQLRCSKRKRLSPPPHSNLLSPQTKPRQQVHLRFPKLILSNPTTPNPSSPKDPSKSPQRAIQNSRSIIADDYGLKKSARVFFVNSVVRSCHRTIRKVIRVVDQIGKIVASTSAAVNTINTIVMPHPNALAKGELTCAPIKRFLLARRSIKIKSTGSKIPLSK